MDLFPIYRIEHFLDAIVSGTTPPEPVAPASVEFYLAKIAGADVQIPPFPISRVDHFLAKICGQNVTLPIPQSREERYLAKIAGEDVEIPPFPINRIDFWLAEWASGSGGTITTVTGVSPLLLANALAKPIKSLTQIGKCEQDGTPTPSAPVDIVCNNGALRMVDDELPAAYKRVLGFTCDNNAMWQITGFKLKGSDTVRISFSVNAACNVFGCYQGADATDNYDLYVSTSSGSKYFRYGNGTYLSAWSAADLGERFDVVYTPYGSQGMPQDSTWSPLTFTSANDLLIGATTFTGTSSKLKGNLYGSIVVDGRLKLIPCERVSDGVLGYYDTYGATFYEPYEGFDGAVSLGYDGSHYSLTVVGTAEVLTVSGAHNSRLPSGYTPCEYISASGTDEYINTGIVINAIGTDVEVDFKYDGVMTGTPKMLWGYMGSSSNLPRWGFGVYSSKWLGSPNATGSVGTSDNTDRHTAVMCVYRGSNDAEVYSGTIDGTELYAANNLGNTSLFTANTLPLILFGRNNNGTAGNFAEAKIYGFKTTENGTVTHELVPCLNAESEAGFYDLITHEFHGNEGTTPLGYAIKYTPNGTASVVNLFAVGDSADTQEIISGAVNRKVGVLVLDGTETWSTSSGIFYIRVSAAVTGYGRQAVLSTHYVGTDETNANMPDASMKTANNSGSTYLQLYCKDTSCANVTEFKAKLAAQYAAGTPVIVLYRLAEETTEQVAGQALHTSAGDNVVSVSSNVDPVTLRVEFMADAA